MAVEIEKTWDGETLIVSFIGVLDQASMVEVQDSYQAATARHRGDIAVDLYECEYIDPEGVEWVGNIRSSMKEEGRQFELYVRPMSLVAHRTRQLPQAPTLPPAVVERGEQRLSERREARLLKWRVERPLPAESQAAQDGTPVPMMDPEIPMEEGDLIPIDFAEVASLSGKDERVVEEVWRKYSELLREGKLEQSKEESSESQIATDSRKVAFELRLDHRVVRKVIEGVSTHIAEVFGVDAEP